jgi:Fe2+ transport system protein FeoA
MKPLRELRPGQSARIAQIGGDRSFRRRLMEMGFLPATMIRLVRRVDIADLLELEVRGSHISLRRSEAGSLFFESEG